MGKDKTMLEEYFEIQMEAFKKYNEHTVLFMQNGTFYESYQTDDLGYNLNNIAELLNFMVTKKNKTKPVSINCPYMLGIPVVTWSKHLKTLVENGYTIVEIAEVTPAPNPRREQIAVHSPATYTDEISNPESNFICSVYIEEVDKMYVTGLTIIDISTGKSYISEFMSVKLDNIIALDDLAKMIQTYQCKEVVITTCNLVSFTKQQLISYLEVADKLHFYNFADDNIHKLGYQQKVLKECFRKDGVSSSSNIIEALNLEYVTYGRISFIIVLNYIKDHCARSLINLEEPVLLEKTNNMYLGNNAIYQLNIFNNDQNNTSNMYYKGVQYKCLFDIINKTRTHMGRRFLKRNLISPLIDIKIIQKRYDIIDEWLSTTATIDSSSSIQPATTATIGADSADNSSNVDSTAIWQKLDDILKPIPDIERFFRKVLIYNIHPIDLYKCIKGIEQTALLLKIDNVVATENLLKDVNNLLLYITNNLQVEELSNYVINDITGPIFIEGIYPDLDKLNEDINNCKNFMELVCKEFNKILCTIATKKKKKILDGDDEDGKQVETYIKVGYTGREGNYFELTKRRCELLENWFENNSLKMGSIIIDKDSLTIKVLPAGSSAKIFLPEIRSKTEQIDSYINTLKIESRKIYIYFLIKLANKYHKVFTHIVDYVSETDFLCSGCKNVLKNKYVKPIILFNGAKKSFIETEQLRHPICEKLTDAEYIPTDISLGIDGQQGILLFGLNSAGKSTLQKSIGINLILAQIGYYVAATKFIYYPYTTLMTRISGNDNMFKGLSSFALEANELKAIIKRSNENTIIIADEVCRGTEHKGSLTVVLTMLELLLKKGCSFITATHLHDLLKYNRVNNMKNLQMYHLHLDYDEENNVVRYDRILKKGPGQSEYGFQLAKHMINDAEFSALANEINEEVNGCSEKASRYNSKVWLSECQICQYKPTDERHKPLETHHINFQRNTDNQGFLLAKPHIHKNHISNLCVLCDKCHDKIDTGELVIYGYEETSEGNVLKYSINSIKSNVVNIIVTDNNISSTNAILSLDDEIKELVNKKLTQKQILNKLEKKATQVYIKARIKQVKSI